jgi:hypothetical protein
MASVGKKDVMIAQRIGDAELERKERMREDKQKGEWKDLEFIVRSKNVGVR